MGLGSWEMETTNNLNGERTGFCMNTNYNSPASQWNMKHERKKIPLPHKGAIIQYSNKGSN